MEPEHDEQLMEFRRQALLAAMQDLSEDCWAAGWSTGLERDLYRIVFERAHPEYGLGWINATERKRMRRWAILTSTWFVWCDKTHMPKTIHLAEANARFQRIPSKQVPEGLRVKEALALYQNSGPEDWELEPPVAEKPSSCHCQFKKWLKRAREIYRLKHDSALYLARRHDFQFTLGYGTCQLDLVQPRWLSSDAFPRAENCTENEPCKRIQRCVACAESSGPDGD